MYIIKETQNLNSDRAGVEFDGSLVQAKRRATAIQAFYGTVLKIEQNGKLIAYKKNGKWIDAL